MKDSHDIQVLKTTIHSENEARIILGIEAPRIAKILKSWEGHKVLKADGQLVKALKDEIIFPEYTITPLHPGDTRNYIT